MNPPGGGPPAFGDEDVEVTERRGRVLDEAGRALPVCPHRRRCRPRRGRCAPTASSTRACWRPQIATRTPSAASALAEANPSPAVAPATAAVRPAMPRSTASDSTLAAMPIDSVDDVRTGLADHDYLADEGLATAVFLALRLHRPLLLEGEAGVGKTEVANVLAAWTGGELVRLQCYEGIDIAQAVYEWDYARQLLHVRTLEATHRLGEDVEDELYSERFLVRRPLLRAISDAGGSGQPPVLLIDEVDRADDEFEAFLLEILADYAVTVPELGTFRATTAADRGHHVQSHP